MKLFPFNNDEGGVTSSIEYEGLGGLEKDGSFHDQPERPSCFPFFLLRATYLNQSDLVCRIITDGETWSPVSALSAAFDLHEGFRIPRCTLAKLNDLKFAYDWEWNEYLGQMGLVDQNVIKHVLKHRLDHDPAKWWKIKKNLHGNYDLTGYREISRSPISIQLSRC